MRSEGRLSVSVEEVGEAVVARRRRAGGEGLKTFWGLFVKVNNG